MILIITCLVKFLIEEETTVALIICFGCLSCSPTYLYQDGTEMSPSSDQYISDSTLSCTVIKITVILPMFGYQKFNKITPPFYLKVHPKFHNYCKSCDRIPPAHDSSDMARLHQNCQ